jgi:NitT/TauT family transport system permease protein
MSSSVIESAPPAAVAAGEPVKAPLRSWLPGAAKGIAAGAAWFAVAAVTAWWPDAPGSDWPRTADFAVLAPIIGAAVAIAAAGGRWSAALQKVGGPAPWLTVLALFAAAWEIASAKAGLLPQPFFPPPQAILDVLTDDWARLGDSVIASLRLLAGGYVIGAAIGFAAGVAVGWSRAFGYWIHPVLRFIGPLPATAWLPLAFFVFPTSFSASTFLIALATGFPVTVLTWSGVAGVNSAWYDIARTLGASRAFLIFKVAIPAAMPHVFVGLFMGLGNSFAVLVVAEMLGVKSGLGWYLQWAQGWAAYGNMYAALIVMALICSGLITLLFRVRDRLLSWQKGLVKW